jgi:septum site-determining protein MinC
MSDPVRPRRSMRFRGRSYIAFVLTPEMPVFDWLADLDDWTRRSAGFFVGKPVVLDLATLDLSGSAIAHLVMSLEKRSIRVLGIEGCDGSRLTQNMPPLLTGGRHAPVQQVEPEKPEVKPPSTSLLLDTPVRSGQSIVFPDGDVTVVGSVASGAEIVAGGSIHVYGTLRGRAMAGVNGNSTARIYCHKMEAELLAIDGYYQTAEEIPDALRDRPVQALLDGHVMRITPLS